MLRIRLTRVGKKKQPAYRLVVADSRSPRDGAFLKIIGHYNPRTEPVTLEVKEDEAVHWLEKGAQPSETVAKLLTRIGVMEKAGKAPFRYVGKEVPPAEKAKKGEQPEVAQSQPAPAAAPAAVEEPVDASGSDAPEAAAEAEEPAAVDASGSDATEQPETPSQEQPEPPEPEE